MKKLIDCAEDTLGALRAWRLPADQEIEVLGMVARMICQELPYVRAHVSPVARGRKILNQGFDKEFNGVASRARKATRTRSVKSAPAPKVGPCKMLSLLDDSAGTEHSDMAIPQPIPVSTA